MASDKIDAKARLAAIQALENDWSGDIAERYAVDLVDCVLNAYFEASEARATALEGERDRLARHNAEIEKEHEATFNRAATAEAQLARAREALEGMLRLFDMGCEASLNEPEENGNFAAYEFARKMLETLRSIPAPADGRPHGEVMDELDHAYRLEQEKPGGGAITSAELLKRAGVDMTKPFVLGSFPPEMRSFPAPAGGRRDQMLASASCPQELVGFVVTTGAGRDYFQRDKPAPDHLGHDWTVTAVYSPPATADGVACVECGGRGHFETGEMQKGVGGWGFETVDCAACKGTGEGSSDV